MRVVISGLQPGGQAERLLEGPEEGGRAQAFSLVSGARAEGGVQGVFLMMLLGGMARIKGLWGGGGGGTAVLNQYSSTKPEVDLSGKYLESAEFSNKGGKGPNLSNLTRLSSII